MLDGGDPIQWWGDGHGAQSLQTALLPCITATRRLHSAPTQYLHFRNALQEEKTRLETRLKEIRAALGGEAVSAPAPHAPRPKATAPKRPRTRRIKNPLSLKQAVLKVTAAKPLTKKEILEGVLNLGYRFGTDTPMRNINALLYGTNPKFRNRNGKFFPAK